MNRTVTFLFVASLLSSMGCEVPPPTHTIILTDSSGSIEPGDKSSCAGVAGLAAHALSQYSTDSRSTITVLATGDAATNFNPTVLFPSTSIPFAARALEGREKTRKERIGLLAAIREACRASIAQREASPIYLSISLSLQQLRALGCKRDGQCALLVQSDLLDTHQEGVARLLKNTPERTSSSQKNSQENSPQPIQPLDMTGIDVLVCGYGQARRTAGIDMTPEQVAHTQVVWSELLRNPRSLSFQPFCPRPTKEPSVTQRAKRQAPEVREIQERKEE